MISRLPSAHKRRASIVDLPGAATVQCAEDARRNRSRRRHRGPRDRRSARGRDGARGRAAAVPRRGGRAAVRARRGARGARAGRQARTRRGRFLDRRRANGRPRPATAGRAERVLPGPEVRRRARSRARAPRLPARASRAVGPRLRVRVDARVAAPRSRRSSGRSLRALLGRSLEAARGRMAGADRALSALLPPEHARGRYRRPGLAQCGGRRVPERVAAPARVARVADEGPGRAHAALDALAGALRRGGPGAARPGRWPRRPEPAPSC